MGWEERCKVLVREDPEVHRTRGGLEEEEEEPVREIGREGRGIKNLGKLIIRERHCPPRTRRTLLRGSPSHQSSASVYFVPVRDDAFEKS